MSYFEKVVDFNTQFGVKLYEDPQPDIFETDKSTVDFGMKLIREEMGELEQAVLDRNFVEVADAIADSIYVLLGLAGRMGIDMDKVFEMVHSNNMSKFCSTESEAEESVNYYLNNPQLGYESPAYRRSIGFCALGRI